MSNSNSTSGHLFIALAIVAAAWLLGNSLVDFKKAGDVISVTGSAKRPIEADLIIWRGELATEMPTMDQAYDKIKRHTEVFKQFLSDNGVPENEVKYRRLKTVVVHEAEKGDVYTRRGAKGKIVAYTLKQPFVITSNRVDSMDAMITRSGDLLADKGIVLWAKSAEYLYTKLAELRHEMLAEATRDAKARAEVMAEASGAKIGKLRSARMGVFQLTQRHSTEVAGYGRYDTSTKEKDITAVAKVSFSLE